MTEQQKVTKETIRMLVDGKLPWEEVKKLIKLTPKDPDRFEKYLEVLQERVPWKDKILMRIHEHLYIVQKPGGDRIVKCDCGQEFGNYQVNWKLSSLVRVRKTWEEFLEVYAAKHFSPDPEWVEIREYYCPGCTTQLSVEVVPPGIPPIFDWLPDIDTFYSQWLGKALTPGNQPNENRTADLTAAWAQASRES